MEKIKTKISILKIRKKIGGKSFVLYLDTEKNKEKNPLGYALSIAPIHKCIFINGYYRYLSKKDFDKFMRDLKKIIKWWEHGR